MQESTPMGRLISETGKHELFFNLALDEVILELMLESSYPFILRFWRNPKAVVLGRGQEIKEEVKEEFCRENNIQIGRRISGGGAVYHDEGNLNISFFFFKKLLPTGSSVKEINVFFANLLVDNLASVGVTDLAIEGTSSILYKDRKISGSAGYQKSNRALHHATLLMDADLTMLEGSLLSKQREPKHPLSSKYWPTTNLPRINLEKWKDALSILIEERLGVFLEHSTISQEEEYVSKILCERMYSTKEWIYFKKRILLKELLKEIGASSRS